MKGLTDSKVRTTLHVHVSIIDSDNRRVEMNLKVVKYRVKTVLYGFLPSINFEQLFGSFPANTPWEVYK